MPWKSRDVGDARKERREREARFDDVGRYALGYGKVVDERSARFRRFVVNLFEIDVAHNGVCRAKIYSNDVSDRGV